MAIGEILRGIERNFAGTEKPISVQKHEDMLLKLLQNTRGGMVYNWIPITVLGQKRG